MSDLIRVAIQFIATVFFVILLSGEAYAGSPDGTQCVSNGNCASGYCYPFYPDGKRYCIAKRMNCAYPGTSGYRYGKILGWGNTHIRCDPDNGAFVIYNRIRNRQHNERKRRQPSGNSPMPVLNYYATGRFFCIDTRDGSKRGSCDVTQRASSCSSARSAVRAAERRVQDICQNCPGSDYRSSTRVYSGRMDWIHGGSCR